MRHRLRVVTWNLWGRYGPWHERAPRIAETLQCLVPDVVCLQEVWTAGGVTAADVLASALGMHAVFSPTRMPPVEPNSGADGLGMAVLGRWDVRDVERRALSTALPGPPAMLLTVAFDSPSGPLHVATTVPVWEQGAGAVRLAQSREIAAALTDPHLDGVPPVVLGADLNARPGTAEFSALTDALTDVWDVAHPGQAGLTFARANRYVTADEWLADGRIDHVLVRPGTPEHPVAVLGAELGGTGDPPPSDHYAVVADLEWSDQPSPGAAAGPAVSRAAPN